MATPTAGFPIKARGGVIVTLSILSLTIFGPLTGIPAWIMANQDLRDIRAGIASGRPDFVTLGKVLAILGTFCSLLSLILLFVLISVALQMFLESPLLF